MTAMGRTGLVLAGIVVANILLLHGLPLYADLIPSAPVAAPAAAASADRVAVEQHLAEAGMSKADIAARVSQLQPRDMAVLAENPKQVQMAAGGPGVVYLLLGLLAIAIVVVLIDSTSQAETPEPVAPAGGR